MPILFSVVFSFLPSVSFAGEKSPPPTPSTRPDGGPPIKKGKLDEEHVTPDDQSGNCTKSEALTINRQNSVSEDKNPSELEAVTPASDSLPSLRKKSLSPRREAGYSDEHSLSPSPPSPTTTTKGPATPETPQDVDGPRNITTVQVAGSQPESDISESHSEMSVVLNKEGIRRIMLLAFFPKVVQNISEDTSVKPVEDVVKIHANLPLHQTSAILEFLSLFNKECHLEDSEISELITPLKALSELVNMVLCAENVEALKKLYSPPLQIQTFTELAISAAGLDWITQAKPRSLKDAVDTLEGKTLSTSNPQPYKLELSVENLTLIATRREQKKALLEQIEQNAGIAHNYIKKAHNQNSVQTIKGDGLTDTLWAESDVIPLTADKITDLTQNGVTHVQIPLLPFHLAEPVLEALLHRLASEVLDNDEDLNPQLAQLLWEGVHLSKPFAKKNDETMLIMAQLLSILVRQVPYIASDTTGEGWVKRSHTLEDLTLAIEEGSSIGSLLFEESFLPPSYDFQEGGSLKLQATPSAKEKALSNIEEDVLSERDTEFLSLLKSI